MGPNTRRASTTTARLSLGKLEEGNSSWASAYSGAGRENMTPRNRRKNPSNVTAPKRGVGKSSGKIVSSKTAKTGAKRPHAVQVRLTEVQIIERRPRRSRRCQADEDRKITEGPRLRPGSTIDPMSQAMDGNNIQCRVKMSAAPQPVYSRPSNGNSIRSYYSNSQQFKSSSSAHVVDDMQLIKSASREHVWQWSDEDRSHECVISEDRREVCFHPVCSDSAAAIRGSEPLKRNGNYYYWEVTVRDKIYGTSVMFGLCTKEQRLHLGEYCNLIGLDGNGWSLSHKGLIWHKGLHSQYADMFPANQTITLGILYDTLRGELSYFMNGKNLGVAFQGLNNVESELYPVVGSTARGTRMRLTGAYCGYSSLLERSCYTLIESAPNNRILLQYLDKNRVPTILKELITDISQVCSSQTETKTARSDHHYYCNVVDRRGNRTCQFNP